jgi:hypothetical protein
VKSLNAEFDSFRQHCIDGDAGEAQLHDMKAAFFAGAICALNVIIKSIFEGGDHETSLRQLLELLRECRQFDALMKAEAIIEQAAEQ